MISRLRGRAIARRPDGVVIDVGGVGYLVQATPRVAAQADAGAELTVETYLHVREDALQLYGFGDSAERELFEHLLSVSGIGPKVALAIVSGSSAQELVRAIAREDVARFQAIPGVGKKTAQRVVLELKEKLGSAASVPEPLRGGAEPHTMAREALVELGFSPGEAEHALSAIDPELPPQERVRLALKAA